MKVRHTRASGFYAGLFLGLLWMLANAVVTTRFLTLPTEPEDIPKIYVASAVPLLLGLFGYFLGSASQEAEEQARQAEHRTLELQTLLNHVGEAIMVIDRDHRIRHITPAYLRLLGLPATDVIGRRLTNLAPQFAASQPDGSPLPLSEAPIMRALRGEEVTNETVVMECDGHGVELLTDAHPVRDNRSGQVVMAISSSRDVTDICQLDRLKDEFIATASHELRTPLTLVRTLAQLTLKDVKQSAEPETAANLENIIEQSDRLAHLVDQMLNASLIDTGRLVLCPEETNLRTLFRKELEQWRLTYPLHTLVLDSPWAEEPGKAVVADPDKLRQVMGNLVANAVRYSPAGSTVTVGVRDVPGGVEVWVKDEGMGVPTGDREAVFAKFYRSPNAVNADRSGLGLGLYISRRLIELHGGRIWLDPAPGKGSTFRFFLPTP